MTLFETYQLAIEKGCPFSLFAKLWCEHITSKVSITERESAEKVLECISDWPNGIQKAFVSVVSDALLKGLQYSDLILLLPYGDELDVPSKHFMEDSEAYVNRVLLQVQENNLKPFVNKINAALAVRKVLL